MIVDDSILLQERLASIIMEQNITTELLFAINTITAIELLEKNKTDIVICDIRMPGGGGFELLKYIKDKYPKIMVIMMTNYPYPQYKQRALELGAEYFFSKTDDLEKITTVLEKYYNGQKGKK